ncbi:hypothetical protein MRX96_031567 [Rhipicephalus microplus]
MVKKVASPFFLHHTLRKAKRGCGGYCALFCPASVCSHMMYGSCITPSEELLRVQMPNHVAFLYWRCFRVSVEVHRHQPSSFGSPLPAPGEDIILLPGTFYSYDGCSFTGLDRVVPAKIRSTVAQEKTYFHEGIKKLEDRWVKCIEWKGDYVEK